MRSWNVTVKAKGNYGWTPITWYVIKARTVRGAVSNALQQFMMKSEEQDKTSEIEYITYYITIKLAEEKK